MVKSSRKCIIQSLTFKNFSTPWEGDNVMPNKYVKFNHYKHKKSEWVTYGIIKSIKYKDKLYKLLKLLPLNSHAYNCAKQNLIT